MITNKASNEARTDTTDMKLRISPVPKYNWRNQFGAKNAGRRVVRSDGREINFILILWSVHIPMLWTLVTLTRMRDRDQDIPSSSPPSSVPHPSASDHEGKTVKHFGTRNLLLARSWLFVVCLTSLTLELGNSMSEIEIEIISNRLYISSCLNINKRNVGDTYFLNIEVRNTCNVFVMLHCHPDSPALYKSQYFILDTTAHLGA